MKFSLLCSAFCLTLQASDSSISRIEIDDGDKIAEGIEMCRVFLKSNEKKRSKTLQNMHLVDYWDIILNVEGCHVMVSRIIKQGNTFDQLLDMGESGWELLEDDGVDPLILEAIYIKIGSKDIYPITDVTIQFMMHFLRFSARVLPRILKAMGPKSRSYGYLKQIASPSPKSSKKGKSRGIIIKKKTKKIRRLQLDDKYQRK